MSDHLPECPDTVQCVYDQNDQCWLEHSQCICEELHACEQRVRQEERNQCIKAIRARRDTLLERLPARPLQTRDLASAIYEDAMATLRGDHGAATY